MRLACVYPRNAPINAQYRALMPMAMLQAAGHDLAWSGTPDKALPMEKLSDCDLIHVYRAAAPALLKRLAECHRAGVAISWDNDDDVTSIPKESPSYDHLGGLRGERDFDHQRRAIQLANTVTTTSRALVRKYELAGARHVELVENYPPPEFSRSKKSEHDGIVIGWFALKEHEVDIKLLGFDRVLTRLLDQHSQVRVLTVGCGLGVRHARYEHRPPVPFEELPTVLGELDIGLAPLADIPFNRARSDIKLKEYALAGVPWLASPVGEYQPLGPSQGGRLVADSDWYEALARLIRSPRQRRYLRLRGRIWARSQTIDMQVGRWERSFEAAIKRRRLLDA